MESSGGGQPTNQAKYIVSIANSTKINNSHSKEYYSNLQVDTQAIS